MRVSRILEVCFAHFLSLEEICSHPGGSPGKYKRLTSVRLPSLKACSTVLARIEEKYPVIGLHVGLAKKEQKHR